MAGSPMFAARLLKTATFTLAQVTRLFEAGSIPISKLVGGTTSLDLGVGPVKVDGIAQSTTGNAVFKMVLEDDRADALSIQQGANKYITFKTSNGTEAVEFPKPITATAGVTGNLTGLASSATTSVSVTTASGTGATGGTAPAFTGTTPTTAVMDDIPSGGTGFATAGQVVTTTDNHTMGLNELANCWLITATQAPCLIISNTAVVGAPAVLTVYGAAPVTNAGTYKILKAVPAAGSVASHTHSGPSHTH